MNWEYYNRHANELIEIYDSVNPTELNDEWHTFIIKERDLMMMPQFALDIGAGTGRDVAFLRANNWIASGIEPCKEFHAHALEKYGVHLIDDSLPHLETVTNTFNLILISGVWMHLDTKDRITSMARLSEIVSTDGNSHLVINTKELDNNKEDKEYAIRGMQATNMQAMKELAEDFGFKRRFLSYHPDVLKRKCIWTTSIFIRKTDG